MMRSVKFILFFFFLHMLTYAQTKTNNYALTPEEISWLNENKDSIRYAPNPFWPPMDYLDENGIHQGLVSDYINVFEKNLNVDFKNVIFKDWFALKEGLKNSKADFVGAIQKTENREEYLLFTDTYLTAPLFVITRGTNSKTDINNMKLAIVKGYSSVEYIKKEYPKAIIVECEDDFTAMLKTSLGATDGTVSDIMTASYIVEKYGVTNLEIAEQLNYNWNIRFACRKEFPILISILNKSLKNISEAEKKIMYEKWVNNRVLYKKTFFEKNFKFFLFVLLTTVISLLLAVIISLILKRKVKKRTLELSNELSEKIKAKEKIEESEKKFRNLFEHSPIGISITYLNGIVYVNQSFLKILGYTKKEFQDKHWSEFTHPDDIDNSSIQFNLLIKGEAEKVHFEKRYIHKNGSIIWTNISSYLQRDKKNKPQFFITAINDITSQKNTEKELIIAKERAEESDRLKSAFLANMSHEIRTPMNGIIGFANLLQNADLSSEEMNIYIDIINKSGLRLLDTINDIIDISKIDSHLMTISLEEIDISEQINDLYLFFDLQCKEKGIDFKIDTSLCGEKTFLKTDKTKFNSIITNLVKNAIKFTKKGSIEIGCIHKDTAYEFYVKDTGIGIPKDRQEAVFNRFEQADIEDKNALQGSGLGLAIAKAYAEMLGGSIRLESEENVGSTFYFMLPKVNNTIDSLKKEDLKLDLEITTDKNTQSKIKILIAEDDITSAVYLSTLLKSENYDLLFATNGLETVEKCKNNSDIDIILMDIKMPEMDGLEATKKIRQFNPNVFIVAQTANALHGDKSKAINAGCNKYISKPINKFQLFSILNDFRTSQI